jgi:hypothetical protein
MSIIGNNYQGLNAPAPIVGSIGAQQDGAKKRTKKELAEWDASRLHIGVDFKEFPDLISTMYSDTQMLSMGINGVLNRVFADYYGSKIEIVQNRQIMTSIFFSEDSSKTPDPNQYKAIELIISKDKLDTADSRIAAINHVASFGSRHLYKITEQGDQLLRDIIPNSVINRESGKIDWAKITVEGSFNTQGIWATRSYVQVSIDLNKMLKVMYGGRTSDGGEWEYMVNVGNPVNPVMTPLGETRANKWQLFVMRANRKDVEDMARAMGFNFGGNDLNIVTGQ